MCPLESEPRVAAAMTSLVSRPIRERAFASPLLSADGAASVQLARLLLPHHRGRQGVCSHEPHKADRMRSDDASLETMLLKCCVRREKVSVDAMKRAPWRTTGLSRCQSCFMYFSPPEHHKVLARWNTASRPVPVECHTLALAEQSSS